MAENGISEIRKIAASLPPTKACAYFTASLKWCHIDADARLHARRHLLDTLGAAMAGATQSATEIVATTLKLAGEADSRMQTAVPGRPVEGTGLLAATHLMGTAAHGLELDDGYRAGMMHPGCVILPVALLLGARLGSSGPDMLTAMTAGYETACRITAATHPKARWRGFHPTSAAGVFAATVTAAKLLQLDTEAIESAIGIAASSSAGLFTFLDGGDVKRLHGGFGAREGLFAALLAKEGLSGPPQALESANGYFHSHAGGDLPENDYSNLSLFTAGGFADRFAITQCYIKPYACCRHIHGPIEMLLALRAKHKLELADIESIHVGTYAVAAAHGTPGWDNMTTAQMSMRYALAVALADGKATPEQFSDAARTNPAVATLCARVFTSIDPACESRYPELRPAKLTVQLKDGRTLTAQVDEPPGEPGRRLSDADVEEKFEYLSVPVIGKAAAKSIIERVRHLADCANVDEILQLCTLTSSPLHRQATTVAV